MRIDQLRLIAFGGFSDAVLDLSAGDCGLHVVYGPNEAGKSTSLKALDCLLFGFPHAGGHDFLHGLRDLRIGAVLRRKDGAVLEVVRRRGNQNTLRAGDDDEMVLEPTFRQFLGPLDQTTFHTMFALDHASLLAGGKSIASGSGEVGEILFSAGGGLADLHQVRTELEKTANTYFLPRGQKPKINELLAALDAAKRDLASRQLPSARGEQLEQALSRALAERGVLLTESDEVRRARQRWDRLREATPIAAERRMVLADLATVAMRPLLPEDRPAERREALSRLDAAEQARREAESALAQIAHVRGTIEVNAAVLEAGEAIERAYRQLGGVRTGQDELMRLTAEYRRAHDDARRLLREAGRHAEDAGLDEAESFRPSRAERTKIQSLAGDYERLVEKVESTAREAAALERNLDQLKARNAGVVEPRERTALHEILPRIEPRIGLQKEHDDAARRIGQLQQQAELELKRLPLWTGTLAALEELAAPQEVSVRRFQGEFENAQRAREAARRRFDEHSSEQLQREQEYERLRRGRTVPTEDELTQLRRERDALWATIRQAIESRDGANDAEPPTAANRKKKATKSSATETVPDGETSATPAVASGVTAEALRRFQELTAQADAAADLIRREADYVAQRAALELAIERGRQEATKRAAEQARAEEAFNEVERRWTELWTSAGVAPLTPGEMLPWLYSHRALVEKAKTLREERQRAAQLAERLAEARDELSRGLADVREAPAADNETLPDLLRRAKDAVRRAEQTRKEWDEAKRARDTLEQSLPLTQEAALGARAALDAWRSDWLQAVAPLRLPQSASPEEAFAVLDALHELFQKIDAARGLRERIETLQAERSQFDAEVNDLAERLAPELLGPGDKGRTPAPKIADELHHRYAAARAMQQRLEALDGNRRKEEERKAAAERDAAHQRSKLTRMCEEAKVETIAELPQAEAESAKRRAREAEAQRLDAQLARLAGNPQFEAFADEALACDRVELEKQIDDLDRRAAALDERRQSLDEEIGRCRNELEKLDGRAAGADAAERVEEQIAEVATLSTEYARLKLASVVLHKAIERYRDKHEGPVLRRACDLFRELTCENFSGLKIESDDVGRVLLLGVRRDGKSLGVDGMSEGTVDQLYLALRLAALEAYLDRHEPTPLIVDDVLINFDDQRSIAALKVLGQFSRRTQVIFFTHHEHLVQLAKKSVRKGTVFTHELRGVNALPPGGKGLPAQHEKAVPGATLFDLK